MATRDGDPYVLNVQQWVNNTYRGKTGYTEIPENGKTGLLFMHYFMPYKSNLELQLLLIILVLVQLMHLIEIILMV